MYDFNFNEWADLYKTDPVEFEHRRKDLLEKQILSSPVEHRNKLRVLQMECDAIRQTHDPLIAASIMTKMAADKLSTLVTPLTQLRAIGEDIIDPQ